MLQGTREFQTFLRMRMFSKRPGPFPLQQHTGMCEHSTKSSCVSGKIRKRQKEFLVSECGAFCKHRLSAVVICCDFCKHAISCHKRTKLFLCPRLMKRHPPALCIEHQRTPVNTKIRMFSSRGVRMKHHGRGLPFLFACFLKFPNTFCRSSVELN